MQSLQLDPYLVLVRQNKTDSPELTKAATMLTGFWESLVYQFQKLELEYKASIGSWPQLL